MVKKLSMRHLFTTMTAGNIVPSLTAIALFVVALFGVVLPASRDNLMEQKKRMISELTLTAWDILAYYEQQSRHGELSVSQAKELARKQIRSLRYGPEEKDYFWINDLRPYMVMHPYRSDLEGRDISDFADPTGKRIFMEFVAVAGSHGSGYVPYMWQWKDDPERIVTKLSYVKLFEPWGWIIGTGVYTEDVDREIAAISGKLVYISLSILTLIVLVSCYIMNQGFRETRKRQQAEEELREHHDLLEERVRERTAELQAALSEIKTLSGFLPICASCKKIRDDKGYWQQIEAYIREHSDAEFSHGICPDCAQRLYPEYFKKRE